MNILISGRPGSGKTTLIEKVVKRVRGPACGFFTREIRQERQRIGFEIESLTGQRDVLATKTFKSRFRIGSYGVNVDAVDRIGVRAIEQGLSDGSLIVIDEIASMELFSERFKQAVLTALDAPNPVLAAVQAKRSRILDSIRARDDVLLFYATPSNRDALVSRISELLGAADE